MKITEAEMRGLIRGECLPADIMVGEYLPAYLVRKFSELHLQQEATEALMLAMRDDSRDSRSKLELITAECAALVNYIDGKCYTESKRTGVYTCAGINKPASPATNAMVNEIRAEGVELFASAIQGGCAVGDRVKDLADEFANQLRADAAKDGE